MTHNARPVLIVDTDAGVDDAMAVGWLCNQLGSYEFSITGVCGNTDAEQVFHNIRVILGCLGRNRSVEVYRGARRPLSGEAMYATRVHGSDGLGGITHAISLNRNVMAHGSELACDHIIRMAETYGRNLTILAIGPLTNLAAAQLEAPRSFEKIGRLVILGGAIFSCGNINKYAEFNFYFDPLAAQIVLSSSVPKVLVPLDLCNEHFITSDELRELVPGHTPRGRFLWRIWKRYMSVYEERRGERGLIPHDLLGAIVMMAIEEGNNIKLSPFKLEVIAAGKMRGAVRVNNNSGCQVDVCVRLHHDLVLQAIRALAVE
jgi:inosine-uridine nucleoside N-ribohydrolase